MLTPLRHTHTGRRRPSVLRQWWGECTRDERRGCVVAAILLACMLAVWLLLRSGLGVIR